MKVGKAEHRQIKLEWTTALH